MKARVKKNEKNEKNSGEKRSVTTLSDLEILRANLPSEEDIDLAVSIAKKAAAGEDQDWR